MSEFQDVMQQYNRMFEAHKRGVSIPIEASYETAVKQPDLFEEAVMSWAAEHPVVYPTWSEWFIEKGILPDGYYHATNDLYLLNILEKAMQTQISADTAQKLGVQPKEE